MTEGFGCTDILTAYLKIIDFNTDILKAKLCLKQVVREHLDYLPIHP